MEPLEGQTAGTPIPEGVSTKLQRIAKLAREAPQRDTVDHCHLRSFLDQRVRDGVIRRTLDKWLKAGVLEGTILSHLEQGTPQVIYQSVYRHVAKPCA